MRGHQGGEGAPLAGEHILLAVHAVAIAGGEHSVIEGVSRHRWFRWFYLSESKLMVMCRDSTLEPSLNSIPRD